MHIEAHTVDADVDQDGIKEIVATVGTAAETSIYKMEKDTLVSVNLNEVMNADVVTYDQESNTFKAEVTKGEMSQWKIEDTLLVPLPKKPMGFFTIKYCVTLRYMILYDTILTEREFGIGRLGTPLYSECPTSFILK